MKTTASLILAATIFSWSGYAQGVFFGVSWSVRTHVGSIDGPVAETNIWGQFLAGANPDALVPVGSPQPHGNGAIYAGEVTVPDVAAFTTAFVQLVAWDSTLWGTVYESVPLDQTGHTDIGTVLLTRGTHPYGDPVIAPDFTQPAVVPVPEPAVWSLAMLGAVGLWFARCWLPVRRR